MQNNRVLPVKICALLFVFMVVSCRDNNSSLQPKPKKSLGSARLIGNGVSYDSWEANLNWQQNNWINQQVDPESIKNSIWSDEQVLGNYLLDKGFSQNIEIAYPLFCYQVAALGALHVESIGAAKAQTWVQMTYADPNSPHGNAIMTNFNVGKGVAQSSYTGDLKDAVYKHMFIDGKNYNVPGSVSIGTFEGVPIFRNPFFRQYDAVTFPAINRSESEIHLSTYTSTDTDTKRHEFGHILQKEHIQSTSNVVSALTCFWYKIAPASIKSAWNNDDPNHNHSCFWTETTANILSANFYCPSFTCWNRSSFPFPGDCSGYEVRTVNQMCD